MSAENGKSESRILQGIVVSNKMSKTATVEVVRTVRHPKYAKFIKKHARYHAHDPQGLCAVGDKVIIAECRPISKTKRWKVSEIVLKASELS